MTWRQLSARPEIDKADTCFSRPLLFGIQRNAVEAKRTGSQDGGGTGHKLNSQKCVYFAVRCLLDTYRGEVYPSYTLIEQGRWQSLY